jgi:hypothetical protein
MVALKPNIKTIVLFFNVFYFPLELVYKCPLGVREEDNESAHNHKRSNKILFDL